MPPDRIEAINAVRKIMGKQDPDPNTEPTPPNHQKKETKPDHDIIGLRTFLELDDEDESPTSTSPDTQPKAPNNPDSADSDAPLSLIDEPVPKEWYAPDPNEDDLTHTAPHVAGVQVITICLHPQLHRGQCQTRQPTLLLETDTEDSQPNSHVQHVATTSSPARQFHPDTREAKITWINQLPYVTFTTLGLKGPCLLDLGSTLSIASEQTADKVSRHPNWTGTWNKKVDIEAYSCNHTPLIIKGLLTIPSIRIAPNTPQMSLQFWVLQSSFAPLILSAQALKELQGVIYLPHDTLQYIPPTGRTVPAGGNHCTRNNTETETEEPDSPTGHWLPTPPTLPPELEPDADTEEAPADAPAPADEPEGPNEEPPDPVSPNIDESDPQPDPQSEPETQPESKEAIACAISTIAPYETKTITVGKDKYPSLTSPHQQQRVCLDNRLPVRITEKGKLMRLTVHNITDTPYRMETNKIHYKQITELAPETSAEITQRIQDRTDARESTKLQGLIGIIDNTTIKFPNIDHLGTPPFQAKTPNFIIFLAYILIVIGTAARITDKTAEQIGQLIEDPSSPIRKLLKEINKAHIDQNLQKLYTQTPLALCAQLHLCMYNCYNHIKQSAATQTSITQKTQTKLKLLNQLMQDTQNLSLLYYYSQTILLELCQAWGRHPFFAFTTKNLQVQQLSQPNMSKLTVNQINSTGETIKSDSQLLQLLYPESQPYHPIHTFQEFEDKTIADYENLQDEADAQLRWDRTATSRRAHHLTDIKNERELNNLLNYSRTPTALHDFVADQTGQDPSPRTIPLSEFHRQLQPAKFICYKTPQEILDDFIPEQVRPKFEKFHQMMSDKHFLKTSSAYRLPDVPPESMFQDPNNELSPLYYIDGPFAGLVDTAYLAFVCSQMIPAHHVILNPEYTLEYTHLCALLFIYGQHIAALHQSHVGLLDPRVFLLRTLLDPSAPTSLNQSKTLPTEPNADLDDKLAWSLRTNRVKLITGAPYLARWTVIDKTRKDPKVITFAPEDPILKHLLSLTTENQKEIAKAATQINDARRKAAHQLQTNPAITVNNMTHALTSLTLAHLHTLGKPKRKAVTKPNPPDPQNHWIKWTNIEKIHTTKITTSSQAYTSSSPPTEEYKHYVATKLLNRQNKPNTQAPKVVRWHLIHTIEYTPNEATDTADINPYFKHYFKTHTDRETHDRMDHIQQVATNSRNLLKEPHATWNRDRSEKKKHRIQYAFPAMPNMPSAIHNGINPTVTESQKKLTNFKTFDRLITECSTLNLENRINPDNPNYNDISQLASQLAVNATETPLNWDSKILLNSLRGSAALQSLLVMTWDDLPHPTTSLHVATTHITSTDSTELEQFKQYGSVHPITRDSTLFKKIPEVINNYTRGLKHKNPLQQKTTTNTISESLLTDIWPAQVPHIASLTTQAVHEQLTTWKALYQKTSDHLKHPIFTLLGNIQSTDGKPQFEPTSLHLHGAEHHKSPPGTHGMLAICLDTHEVFPFRTTNSKTVALFQNLIESAAANQGPTSWTLTSLLIALQHSTQKQDQLTKPRYSCMEIEHLQKKVAMKANANRFIINAKWSNKVARASNTQFQPLSTIQETLGNSRRFTAIDFASMYDSIPCDPISSLLSCVSYNGREIAPLVASMGGTNSCQQATTVILSIFRHARDSLPLSTCYKKQPLPPELMNAQLQNPKQPMTIQETYDVVPPLHLSACALLRKIADRECHQTREEDPENHYLPITAQERHELSRQPRTRLLDFTALLDDACIASRDIPQIQKLHPTEQIRAHLNMHIHALKTVFIALLQASPPVQNSTTPSPMKIKFEKSTFFSDSARFLNYVYLRGHVVINLDAYKKHYTSLDQPPETDEDLKSFLSWLQYFSNYIPCLWFLVTKLNKFATQHPGSRALPWEKNKELFKQYKTLTLATRQISGLQVLPDDLTQVAYLVISSDASNETYAHNIGVALKPTTTQASPTVTLHLVSNYSAQLPDNLLNSPIIAKECAAAVKAADHLEEILKLTASIPKYLLLDNANLFQYLTKLERTNQLAAHYMAHPNLKEWILRLYEVTHIYNIQIRLITSKYCMADHLSRIKHKTQNNPVANTNLGCPTEKRSRTLECQLCPGCQRTCTITQAHKGCKFSISSMDQNKPPNLLQYSDLQQHTIPNEKINYTTASVKFNPDNYIKVNLEPLVAKMPHKITPRNPQTPQETLDMPTWTSDYLEQLTAQEIKESQELGNQLEDLNITASTFHPNADLQHQWCLKQSLYQHQITQHKNKYWIVPNHHSLITNTGQKYPHGPNHCIILFTTENKGLHHGQSKYIKYLHNTAAPQLNQRINNTNTIRHNDTTYMLMCASKQRPIPTASTDQLFPQLNNVLYQATKNFPEHTIVLDHNSCNRLYNISAKQLLLLTAMNTTVKPTSQEIIVYSNTARPEKTAPDQPPPTLSRLIPVLVHKHRKAIIQITLDQLGNCPEAVPLALEALERNNTKPNYNPDKAVLNYPNTTAQATDAPNYAKAKSIEFRAPNTVASVQNAECPTHENLIAKHTIRIHQEDDPTLLKLRKQITNKNGNQHNRNLITRNKKTEIKIQDGILLGRDTGNLENQWKPILPENQILQEIAHTHFKLKCAPTKPTIANIESRYYHKTGTTSPHNLAELAKNTIIPCPRCIIRKPYHLKKPHLYGETRSILASLGLQQKCALAAHDILYLAKTPTENLPHPYISLFVCYGCGFVHVKGLDKINGENIAQHFLEYCQTSGGPPQVLITDTHTAEIKGALKHTIADLNIIATTANQKIQQQAARHIYTGPRGEADENTDALTDPPNFPTAFLKDLTEDQQAMLLQDFDATNPPLVAHTTTHSPPPNLTYHAFRNTSLGRLDKKCMAAATYIRHYITRDKPSPSQVDHLLQSYAYYNNFLTTDIQTKMTPAHIHLGALKHTNLSTYYNNLTGQNSAQPALKSLQDLLQLAHTYQEAERNRTHRQETCQAAHIKRHGILLTDEEFKTQYAPFTLVFLKAEHPTKKIDTNPPFNGPYLIIAHITQSRILYLFELLTGKVYKRSYRSMKSYLPSPQTLTLPTDILTTWLSEHPLQLIRATCQTETTSTTDHNTSIQTILENLDELYNFLQPVLPDGSTTQNYINSFLDITEPTSKEDTEQGQPEQPINQQLTVQFQDDDPNITDLPAQPPTETQPPVPDTKHAPLGPAKTKQQPPAPRQKEPYAPRRSPRTAVPNNT